jgi:DNA topoisomerase-1
MPNTLTISRRKQGKGFAYVQANTHLKDSELLSWYDNAGRQQAIYNPSFRKKQERLKFDRTLRFAEALPRLRKRVSHDLDKRRLTKDKVLACVVKLIDTAYFRVGNERYAQENNSYGVTTLRHKHLDISGSTVTFEFMGKSGQQHVKQITDKQLVRIVKQLDELPGYEIFRYKDEKGILHDIQSKDVNEYIKTHMGDEFSAKDFRTWGGTLLATTELLASEYHNDKKQRQKMVTAIVKNVAKRLGNTPTIARSSYIDPRVIAAYVESKDISRVKKAMDNMRPRSYMSFDEQCVLKLLA